ncbi:hypothetical protein E5K00_09710 [Hymenobacter aquaticus]|uniref:Uncharacterized protein n=1 Tax=Hymenobacter aquaticus TaxID=1867101 RepID=A0A4Z0Q9P0_9BACT|nr:hypothetical protein [Hymenobacter aquaticus]TGE25442.1 hypothetical protein E5K00_09710 [Hymenobacter aquaticus]
MPFLDQRVEQLPAWLAASPAQRLTFTVGIPHGASDDQLSTYVAASISAYQAEFNHMPLFGIRADRRLSFAQLKHITGLLQKQGINRFSLLTDAQSY